jgi:hypothetical protein
MDTQRRNLYILAFILLVVMLGYGIIIPIFPFYIESMNAGGMELGLLAASYAAMRLIFGPSGEDSRIAWGASQFCSSGFWVTLSR